jgi:hypothetical protein
MIETKWKMNELIPVLNKRGFWDTFYILNNGKQSIPMPYVEFNEKLKEFSYLNSFLRVKGVLIDKNIIEINKIDKKRTISLTKKGIEIYKKLIEIESIFNSSNRFQRC